MNILHVIPSIAQVRGGTSQAVLDMVQALRHCGINAEIATTNDAGAEVLDVPLGQRAEYAQVPVYFFPRCSSAIAPLQEFSFSWQFTTWLWQNIQRYDVLHVHALFSYPATAAMAIARLRKVPYIALPHGLLCEWSLLQSTRKKQIYLRLIERSNLNHSQVLHLTSEKEKQELVQLRLNVPSFVLPHGLFLPKPVPFARQRLRQLLNCSDDEPIVLFLSRLHPKKGLDYLIPALGKLTHYRFHFVIAGSGEASYMAEVQHLIASHGLGDRTHLVGFAKGELKNLLLQGSDLFALTSHSENFAVVVLEALAAGLPVLVTPGVALSMVVQQHQLGYVPELETGAIAAALQHYLDHRDEARDISQRAQQLMRQHYSWDSIATQLIDIYHSILTPILFEAAQNKPRCRGRCPLRGGSTPTPPLQKL